MTITGNNARTAVWALLAFLAAVYTIFALWAVSPLNTYDEPQNYNMILLDRWDESYTGGKSPTYHQNYRGMWKEEKSGNVLNLTIDGRMFQNVAIGTPVMMSFKPSRMGLQDSHEFTLGLFPFIWLLVIGVCGLSGVIVIVGNWLFNYDEEE